MTRSATGRRRKEALQGWMLLVPALAIMLVFTVYPVFRSVYLSLFKYRMGKVPEYIALENYTYLFGNSTFWKVMRNKSVPHEVLNALHVGTDTEGGYLVPDEYERTLIEALEVKDDAIRAVIDNYTMESGVRGLKKQMETLCRYAAVEIVENQSRSAGNEKGAKKNAADRDSGKTTKAFGKSAKGKTAPKKVVVGPDDLRKYLDQKPIRHDQVKEEKRPGIVTGLAWTAAGGEILFIETLFTKGTGKVVVTGQLGDVMKESVQIAISLVKAMYPDKVKLFAENDLHIHVPEGAIPKDGPSAGITLTTALASLVTGREVSPQWGMTGEVSLRGGVMPIGGLPEKLMAAQRAGITQVFIPEENREDLEEVAEEVRSALKIFPVKKVSDVLEMLQLQPLVSEKKGRKKKEKGIAADPFHNVEAFWGVKENPIKLRPVE